MKLLSAERPGHEATTAHAQAAYPFVAEGGLGGRGAYIGRDAYGGSFVYDPWELYGRELTSPNMLVIGQLGRAKSSLVKTYLWRQSVFSRRAWVIDPKGEYGPLADAFGVEPIALEPGGPYRLNPITRAAGWHGQLQLLQAVTAGALRRALLPEEEAGLREALKVVNRHDEDPTLPAVVDVLLRPTDEMARALATGVTELAAAVRQAALGLQRLCEGDIRGMFDGPTTAGLDLSARLVVIDLHAVYDSAALGILMTCAAAWLRAMVDQQRAQAEQANGGGVKLIVVVDEGWRIFSHLGIGEWLQDSFKHSRAYGIQNVIVMHRLSDLRAAGAEGSREARLAEGLLADTETRVIYAQPTDQLAATRELLGLTETESRAAAHPAARRGAVEGRPALLPRPPPPVDRRVPTGRHRRADGGPPRARRSGANERASADHGGSVRPPGPVPGGMGAPRWPLEGPGDPRAGLVESVVLAAAGLVAVAAVGIWLVGQLAGALFGAGWPTVGAGDVAGVLVRLPGHLGDPRQAWPTVTQPGLPGAGGFYAALAVLGLVAAVLALVGLRVLRRVRPLAGPQQRRRERGASWARRSELRPLLVNRPQPGRLTLGRVSVRLVAAEERQSVIVVAPTQSLKTTGLAIPALLEWEGPVLAASVKTDLLRDTLARRRALGEVFVFDPTQTTGLPGSGWTPLAGCQTWQGAQRTATWLCAAARTGPSSLADGDFWYAAAAKLLGPVLFAAATSGASMADVVRWIDTQEQEEVKDALIAAGVEAALLAAEATWQRDERQRSSIYTTTETVLAAYADPGVLQSAELAELTPQRLLDGGAHTAYLCAPAHEQQRLRPLFATLIQDVVAAVYERAARTGAPLDPPLLIVLDEAANIAPLRDLDVLAATGAGQGIQLVSVFQDLAQLKERWGERAQTIVNNHRAKILGAGTSDPHTLELAARVLGDEEIRQTSATAGHEGHGSTTESTTWRALAPAHVLREARPGTGVLIYGHLPPAQLDLAPVVRRPPVARARHRTPSPAAQRGMSWLRERPRRALGVALLVLVALGAIALLVAPGRNSAAPQAGGQALAPAPAPVIGGTRPARPQSPVPAAELARARLAARRSWPATCPTSTVVDPDAR